MTLVDIYNYNIYNYIYIYLYILTWLVEPDFICSGFQPNGVSFHHFDTENPAPPSVKHSLQNLVY